MELLDRISGTFGVPVFVFAIILIIAISIIILIIYNMVTKHQDDDNENLKTEFLFETQPVEENKKENFNSPMTGEKWYYRETYKDTSNNKTEGLPWPNLKIDPVEIIDVRGNWVKFKDENDEIKISPYFRFNEIFMKDVYGDVVVEEPEPEPEPEPEINEESFEGFIKEDTVEEETVPEPTLEMPGTINIGGVEYTLVKNS